MALDLKSGGILCDQILFRRKLKSRQVFIQIYGSIMFAA